MATKLSNSWVGRQPTEEQLNQALKEHSIWLETGEKEGQQAQLQRADLQRTSLQEANLRRASLQGANLQGANLQGANLQGANLQGANLQGANLQGAKYDSQTQLPDDFDLKIEQMRFSRYLYGSDNWLSDEFDPETAGMVKVD